MISFGVKYWFILLIAALVVSFLASLLSYHRNKAVKDFSRAQVFLLAFLRFLSVFSIGLLLLSPFIRNLKKITQDPVIIAAWDNSSSLINNPDSLEQRERMKEAREKLIDQLNDNFRVVEYGFGEKTFSLDQLTFTDKQSDYSEMITSIYSNHFNENIGALIVAGDGIYNSGRNPINQLSDINFPVYTIGFGDTTEVMDAGIRSIRVNRTSFAGNKFPVEVDIQFKKLEGRPLELTLSNATNLLHSTVITPSNENFFTTREFILEAGEAGMKHFSVRIEPVRQERNTANNRSGFVINVLENKQKILILSNGPHPDIGAIKNTLEQQRTYDVTVFTQDPFPSDLTEYNLIILNQLPSQSKSISGILQKARENRVPLLYIIGNKTYLNQFNALSSGAKITPLELIGEEAQASVNPAYGSFNLSEELKEIIPDLPPLEVAFADYELDAEFTPLLYQKILNLETSRPLIATGLYEEKKAGFIFGEGIWRWRLYDYYINQDNSRFNEMINKLIQFLALRLNEENLVIQHKMVYAEIDEIVFDAEVYNDAFERVSGSEINIEIVSSTGDEYKFAFDVSGINYQLNAGHLPTGDYLFRSSVKLGNNTYEKEGSFTVMPVNLESTVTQANHNLLFNLASGSGGAFFTESEVDQLTDHLLQANRISASSYYQEMVSALLDQKWIFLLILLLLSVEWFLRKFWGVY